MHATSTPIANVTELGYSTKQVSASFAGGDPSYQIPVYLNGTTGFTTLVYEPYQNGTVTPGVWQSWDVDQGQFWSSRAVTCPNDSVVAGGGGAPFYTLEQLKTMCPNAVVIGFGVNIGSNNPSYNVLTDSINFNGTTYNFEVNESVTPTTSPSPSVRPPANKDACMGDGYKNFTDANGNVFKNQGQCVSYVQANEHSGKQL